MKFFKILVSFFLILSVAIAYAADTASILPPAKTTFFDQNGKPLTSGTVDFYIPGSSVRKTTWQDAAETIANLNPVILDSAGRALILGSGSYRQVVKDRNNNVIWDQVTSSAGSGGGGSTSFGDGNPVGFIMPWSGFVVPTGYVFAYGQELNRTTFNVLLNVLTITQSVSCTSGNATLNTVADTSQISVGAVVEAACLPANSTVTSKSSSTVTVNNLALVTTTNSAIFYPYGNGNGFTTFNVPDYRGVTLAGRTNMGGAASSNLTSSYFSSNSNNTPAGLYAKGGVENTTLTVFNLPPITSSNASVPITVSTTNHIAVSNLNWAGTSVVSAGSVSIAFTGGSIGDTQSLSGNNAITVTSVGPISTPFSRVQPTTTINYIIKTTPDAASTSVVVVNSIQGMTGNLTCGAGMSCTAGVISAALAIGETISGGTNTFVLKNSSGVLGEVSPTTTVNGQACTLGSTCTISASAGTITPGTTTIASGTDKGLLYDNAGILGNLATANSGVLITSGTGVPSVSATLPSALTIPSPVISGTASGAGTIPSTMLVDTAVSASSYGSSTAIPNFTVNSKGQLTAAGTNAVVAPAGTLSGATLNATVTASSLTSVGTLATGTWQATAIALGFGGTNNALTASNGGVVWSDASKLNILAGTVTAGQCLLSGSTAAPTWGSCAGGATVTSIAGNTGAFTLGNGIDNSTNVIQLTAARRTLPTVQAFTSGTNATYNTPANVLWIELTIVGGGGGGDGSTLNGGTGSDTCWKASGTACSSPLYQASGGSGSTAAGATGGTATGGSSACTTSMQGGAGLGSAAVAMPGSAGGMSSLGGNGKGGIAAGTASGSSAAANSGSGGGGATGAAAGFASGAAGGTCYVVINSPAASYVYTVGSGGTGGTGAQTGGNGGAGYIRVIEHYGT